MMTSVLQKSYSLLLTGFFLLAQSICGKKKKKKKRGMYLHRGDKATLPAVLSTLVKVQKLFGVAKCSKKAGNWAGKMWLTVVKLGNLRIGRSL